MSGEGLFQDFTYFKEIKHIYYESMRLKLNIHVGNSVQLTCLFLLFL